MNSICLTRDELKELTDKVYHRAQCKVLNDMGIAHRTRPDGSVVVLYSDVGMAMDKTKAQQPNFESLSAAS